jgi:DNA-binding GntR family transcriptional regulator
VAAQLGVSRMPLREALLRLERLGMIEMSASRFTRVAEMTEDDARDVLVYAGVQASWAARLAIERMGDDELATACELLSSSSCALADGHPLPLPAGFAAHIARHARSRSLAIVGRDFDVVLATAARVRPPLADATRSRLASAYDRLREAMAGRDADDAERIVREIHLVYAS